MNYRPILIFFLSLFPVTNVISQQNNDLFIHADIVKFDSTRELPKLKDSFNLCEKIKQTWDSYLQTHSDFRNKISSLGDSSFYFASLNFRIDKFGKLSRCNKKHISFIDSICNEAFYNILQESPWIPFYQKIGNTKIPIESIVFGYFTITSMGMQSIEIEDQETAETVFECHL